MSPSGNGIYKVQLLATISYLGTVAEEDMSPKVVRLALMNQTSLLLNSMKRRLLNALPKQKKQSYGPISVKATQSLASTISIMLI